MWPKTILIEDKSDIYIRLYLIGNNYISLAKNINLPLYCYDIEGQYFRDPVDKKKYIIYHDF